MSRTYRFKKENDSYLVEYNRVLTEWIWVGGYYSLRIPIDPTSKESKKRLVRFHSDAKKYFWVHKGPGWFHNITQRKYRTLVKSKLSKFYKDPEYEIQLLRKPYREYWN